MRRQGTAGINEARKIEQRVRPPLNNPINEVINDALSTLIEWKRDEFKLALEKQLQDANQRAAEDKWPEALSGVEEILRVDPQHAEAQNMLYRCLVKVAEQEYANKKRGDAAAHLRRVIEEPEDKPQHERQAAPREDPPRGGQGRRRRDLGPQRPQRGVQTLKTAKKGRQVPDREREETPIENWIPVKLDKDAASAPGWIAASSGAAGRRRRGVGHPQGVRGARGREEDALAHPRLRPRPHADRGRHRRRLLVARRRDQIRVGQLPGRARFLRLGLEALPERRAARAPQVVPPARERAAPHGPRRRRPRPRGARDRPHAPPPEARQGRGVQVLRQGPRPRRARARHGRRVGAFGTLRGAGDQGRGAAAES